MKKITHLEFVEMVKNIHGSDIVVVGKYKNSKTKITVRHKCGYEWETIPQIIYKGHGCPKCKKCKKKNTADFKKEIFNLVGNEYSVLSEYVNTHTKIKIKHNTCKTEFYMEPNAFLSGQRCPSERYNKSANSNSISKETADKRMKEITNGEYKIIDGYNSISKKCKILHTICNRYFYGTPSRIINDLSGCQSCNMSKGESLIRKILLDKNIKFIEQYRIKECKNKRPLPFDFAILENNKIKMLIEYDGIQHFKPKFGTENFNKTVKNDSIKNNFCLNNNIPLLRIKYLRTTNSKKLFDYINKQISNSISVNKPINYQATESL